MQKGFSLVLILIIAGILVVVSGGGYWYFQQQKLKSITDFDSCAKYYPVLTSYPGQCITSDGRHFVQQLTDEEKKKLVPPPETAVLPEKNISLATPSSVININLPGLYPKISWEATQSATFEIHDYELFDGVKKIVGQKIASKVNSTSHELMQDFFGYYDNELLSRGWAENGSEMADGVDGGVRGYKKGDYYINVTYDGMHEHPNAKETLLSIEYGQLH